MDNKKIKSPMYFAKLEIDNIKCFGEKVVLDLTDDNGAVSPWTLLLGDNGVGKTTLLKCLAWMTTVEETDNERKENSKITKIAIKPLMDDFEDNSAYERIVRAGKNVKSRVSAQLTNNVKLGEIPKSKQVISHALNIELDNNSKLKTVNPELFELSQFNSPNLFAYSANRHMAFKNIDKSELKDPISNLFSESGDLYDAEQVLINLDYASMKEKENRKGSKKIGNNERLLIKVKEMLVDLLPDIENTDCIIINPTLNSGMVESAIEIKTPYGKVSLYELSLGYKTMFAWVVDLALRMFWMNIENEKPLEEAAVVIVDEIDLHLHPKWQRIIKDFLRKHFPNTQFICTAHSPFMAQDAERDNICILSRVDGQVQINNRPDVVHGWRIGEIVTNLFGVSERSPEATLMIEHRRNLLDKKKRTKNEDLELDMLDEKISSLPVKDENQSLVKQIEKLTKTLLKVDDKN